MVGLAGVHENWRVRPGSSGRGGLLGVELVERLGPSARRKYHGWLTLASPVLSSDEQKSVTALLEGGECPLLSGGFTVGIPCCPIAASPRPRRCAVTVLWEMFCVDLCRKGVAFGHHCGAVRSRCVSGSLHFSFRITSLFMSVCCVLIVVVFLPILFRFRSFGIQSALHLIILRNTKQRQQITQTTVSLESSERNSRHERTICQPDE